MKQLKKQKKILLWLIAVCLIIMIQVFSVSSVRVEYNYTDGIYPYISALLCYAFGWMPFSFGDILYSVTWMLLLYLVIKNIVYLVKRGFNRTVFFRKVSKVVLTLMYIYIVFNIFWGLNYNRQGIAAQLNLPEVSYDTSDLYRLNDLLIEKVNESKRQALLAGGAISSKKELFHNADKAYKNAAKSYSFLDYGYRIPSLKRSIYGWLGNYFGFTGYYNPFTGEAQVNMTVPAFLQPYIITHEVGHQLGYAKEDEASFAGYLAVKESKNPVFYYSAYLDILMYANRAVYYEDSLKSINSLTKLDPAVIADLEEWRKFNASHQSFVEPVIRWMYSKYLKMNQQPEGMKSYGQVISLMIAYQKKFGDI